MKTIITALSIAIASIVSTFANNATITAVATVGNTVTFNIAWANSWNAATAPNNWDAVWLFIKYQDCSTPTVWSHAKVVPGSTVGAPLMVEDVTDSMGIFVRRSTAGAGNIAATAVTMQVNMPTGTYNIKVFGIEMVYAPAGNFEIGDNSTSNKTFINTTVTAALQTSGIAANAIQSAGGAGFTNVALPTTYPMGYNGFYCMKYEITQQQYVEMLNTLTYDQQTGCTFLAPNVSPLNYSMTGGSGASGSNGISTDIVGVASTTPAHYTNNCAIALPHNSTNDGQWNACNYLKWADLTAYLDWSALRPITELEMEKVCRGFNGRVNGEFPWGNNTTNSNTTGAVGYTAVNTAGDAPVSVQNGPWAGSFSGLCQGAKRVGYAAQAASTRVTAGAAYFGAMDMAGNVWEQVVNTSTAAGATFTALHGNGVLLANGNADVANWPNVTTGLGTGRKGSSCDVVTGGGIQISDRSAINVPTPNRECGGGGRGGRTY
ncbi:MAG: SUMF1/EgtB/PvdO family nonheme iron enzyme [Bacteroidia bacterium]